MWQCDLTIGSSLWAANTGYCQSSVEIRSILLFCTLFLYRQIIDQLLIKNFINNFLYWSIFLSIIDRCLYKNKANIQKIDSSITNYRNKNSCIRMNFSIDNSCIDETILWIFAFYWCLKNSSFVPNENLIIYVSFDTKISNFVNLSQFWGPRHW